ncbi:hypothetical protein [Catellatospora coxensis]|uniref:Uncharacterized protein n=1 Tax=Catellatospora coxensis TaxID=310354 RepID=A0A8J3LAE2_9ACTN|nr:hypothetical protein [Catellatospora coxensis]GIG10975.1 hypothetical protein Cco03nite_76750 [Catellatospora coxensis]
MTNADLSVIIGRHSDYRTVYRTLLKNPLRRRGTLARDGLIHAGDLPRLPHVRGVGVPAARLLTDVHLEDLEPAGSAIATACAHTAAALVSGPARRHDAANATPVPPPKTR